MTALQDLSSASPILCVRQAPEQDGELLVLMWNSGWQAQVTDTACPVESASPTGRVARAGVRVHKELLAQLQVSY